MDAKAYGIKDVARGGCVGKNSAAPLVRVLCAMLRIQYIGSAKIVIGSY